MGPHTWLDMHSELSALEKQLSSYVSAGGELPSEFEMNRLIERVSKKTVSEGDFLDRWPTELVSILEYNCGPWRAQTLPHYVESSSLAGGFGFFWPGEDGMSESRGNDVDDINSWDRQSAEFYQNRWRERERRIYFLVAAISSLVACALCWLLNRPFREST